MVASCLSVFAAIKGYGVVAVVAVVFGACVAALAHSRALRFGASLFSNFLLLGGLSLAAWMVMMSGQPPEVPSHNLHPASHLTGPHHGEHVVISATVSLEGQPTAIWGNGSTLDVLDDGHVDAFDPDDVFDQPARTDVGPDAYDIAADSQLLAIIGGGTFALRHANDGTMAVPPFKFGELAGPAAIGLGAVWICNLTHAKLERFGLGSRVDDHLYVPGPPADVVITGDTVWVAGQDVQDDTGWLQEFDQYGHKLGRWRIPPGPGVITVAFGYVWVVYTNERKVIRFSVSAKQQAGPPIRVAGGTDSIVAYATKMWATSSTRDVLQSIDPTRGVVDYWRRLPEQPVGVVVSDGHLFTASGQESELLELSVVR